MYVHTIIILILDEVTGGASNDDAIQNSWRASYNDVTQAPGRASYNDATQAPGGARSTIS